MNEGASDSYLDYDTFLDPKFSATSFANTLVLATNDVFDSPLDLSTPLSRVLFDVQEVDTLLENLTATSALSLLNYTKQNVQASERILQELEAHVVALIGSYQRLEREVVIRHEAAAETRLAATRVWDTLKLGRSVGRCLTLARHLEAHMSDIRDSGTSVDNKEDSGAMVRASSTILSLRQLLEASGPGADAERLNEINVIRSLRKEMIAPAERAIVSRAETIVGQFSMSSLMASKTEPASSMNTASASMTFSHSEDTKSRATSALITLYLLSPVPQSAQDSTFEPSYLILALQDYLKKAITSSLAGLSSALATLPKLDRTLSEVSARCQNIVALGMLLESLKPPVHPLITSHMLGADHQTVSSASVAHEPQNLLQPLLLSLDTSSLPSYFWRSMASQLTTRVQRILKDGGVSARTLRSNKERLRDSIRQCVNRGSTLPAGSITRGKAMEATLGNWEREAAVMVGSVVNAMGR